MAEKARRPRPEGAEPCSGRWTGVVALRGLLPIVRFRGAPAPEAMGHTRPKARRPKASGLGAFARRPGGRGRIAGRLGRRHDPERA
jgi:hypothetical protein